jgi:hypothetical protein
MTARATERFIGDIIAINGQTMRGTWTQDVVWTLCDRPYRPPKPCARGEFSAVFEYFDFQRDDGAAVGGITASSYTFHAAGPYRPRSQPGLDAAGVNGIFTGTRGYATSETLANGDMRRLLTLIAGPLPAVMEEPEGLMVMDSTMTPISAANPAIAGQTLILMVSGLGPTTPGNDGHSPFPADVAAQVNSPIEAMVNGEPATVLSAAGWPGLCGAYRVEIRIPADTAPGDATLQIVAAFIKSEVITIPVR